MKSEKDGIGGNFLSSEACCNALKGVSDPLLSCNFSSVTMDLPPDGDTEGKEQSDFAIIALHPGLWLLLSLFTNSSEFAVEIHLTVLAN